MGVRLYPEVLTLTERERARALWNKLFEKTITWREQVDLWNLVFTETWRESLFWMSGDRKEALVGLVVNGLLHHLERALLHYKAFDRYDVGQWIYDLRRKVPCADLLHDRSLFGWGKFRVPLIVLDMNDYDENAGRLHKEAGLAAWLGVDDLISLNHLGLTVYQWLHLKGVHWS